jgi:phospholipase C
MMARLSATRLGSLVSPLALAVLSAACSAENASAQPPCEGESSLEDPVFEVGAAGASDTTPHHDAHHDERWACEFMPQAKPKNTVSGDIEGLRDNVKHVFVLMLENRSFDQFLSQLPQAKIHEASEVDVATDQTNPQRDGGAVERYPTTHLCLEDLSHEWFASHLQDDNGLNDGFVVSGGKRAMAYYAQESLQFHYFLADEFAISDRYFSSVMGPTWPNHLFFWGGTSCGYAEDAKTNAGVITDCGVKVDSLFTQLGKDIQIFDDSGAIAVGSLIGTYRSLPKSIEDFKQAAGNETPTHSELPKVVMLGATNTTVPFLKKLQDDDHASVNVQLGQQFIFDMVKTITSNDALWRSSVLFITWDESGGFYDHVPPPKACHPEPDPHADTPRFDRLGFRVPLYVISPFARRHYVSHYITDHTSILRFIETLTDLPAFTKRDANAWAMLDFFDFANPHYDLPELDATLAEPSAEGRAECDAKPKGFDDEP